MPIRNRAWYNQNEQREYPLDARATCRADDGTPLPQNILADLHLLFPETVGNYAFVGAVSVTETLVTVTFHAADALDSTEGFQPLAVFTALKASLEPGRQFAVSSQYPGVGGWVVFGFGITSGETFTGRFSLPAQSLVMPKAARAYRELPVRSLGKLHADAALTGVVTLRGVEPLEIVGETREIGGEDVPAIVIRLKQPASQEQSVFEEFSGSCGPRPESRNCGLPEPIEFLGPVGPDCDGNITIEFDGCADVSRIHSGEPGDGTPYQGALIDCDLGLVDVCARRSRIPDENGRLPNEYDDLCEDEEEEEEEECENPWQPGSIDENGEGCTGSLPHLDNFDDMVAACWEVVSGAWNFVGDDSPSEGTQPNPAAPVISGPTDPTADTTPTFDWNNVTGATHYELWVNNLSTGGTKVIYETNLLSSSYTPSSPMDPGIYEFWVRAYGIQNSRSVWSSRYEFTISGTPVSLSDAPTPTQPTNSPIPGVNVSWATEHPNSPAGRNVLLWNSFDNTSVKRIVTTDIKLTAGPPGSRHNGGVCLNWVPTTTLPGRDTYYTVELDFDKLKFQITYFNGITFEILTSVDVPSLALNRWYRIKVTTGASFFNGTNVTATLQALSGTALLTPLTLGPYRVTTYPPGTGILGFATNRAATRFSWVKIEQAP